MASIKKSVVTSATHPDGRNSLKVSSGNSSLQQGASSNIASVVQGGKVLDPAKVSATPGPSSITPAPVISAAPAVVVASAAPVAPTPPPANRYYIDLAAHNMTDLIQANSAEEAWRTFCNRKGIVSSDREVLMTEFA